MLNTINHHGNANQNYNEIPPHPVWRKRDTYTLWWECKLLQLVCKIEWMFFKKLKIALPYDPAILLLGI
jgi:hypothetical protein